MPKFTGLALLVILLLGCESYAPQSVQHGIFSACCGGVGTCVPTSAVSSEDASLLTQDQCDESLVCAPTGLVESASYKFPTCQAYGQSEGRCLPKCLPSVAEDADTLDRSTCDEASVCVPCFDPLSGESTGACTREGDAPTQPASLFGECCEGRGRCIPTGAIEDDLESRLATDSCETNSDRLCVPDMWVDAQPQVPTTCHGYGGAEGRCLPSCLGDVGSQPERFLKDVCEGTDLCVPCFDPVTGEDTKACSTTGDPGPTEAKVTFATCCGAQGACVPTGMLREDEKSSLSADTCAQDSGAALCVPSTWISDPGTPAATCRAFGEMEGRCLPACLPDVVARSSSLHQDGCADEQLCVPCFDPVSGEGTGACNIGSDPGPQEQAKLFDKCCGDQGSCVPTSSIDDEDRTQLVADSCGDASEHMCVPDSWITAGAPPGCTAPGSLEGRCMPSCLPSVAARADQLVQADCAAAQLCVPCFDPLTGESTHACEVGRDMPTTQAKLFPACCNGSATCVPKELVSADVTSQLDAGTCGANSAALCVPNKWVGKDEIETPQTCRATGNSEGRCMSECLSEVVKQKDRLTRDSCSETDMCVPCYDPISGADTGACHLNGDAPTESPVVFAQCCSARGHCVPSDIISAESRDDLAADSCTGGALCTPDTWLNETQAPTCRGYANAEGRCLPDCLPAVSEQQGRLLTAGCAQGSACVPCYDPVTGKDTGACSQPGDAGPSELPRTFSKCGSNTGRCVPSTLVSDASRLSSSGCSASAGELCVPATWLDASFTAPPTCRAPGNLEGRCLADFLPDVQGNRSNLRQTTCGSHELCVPCFDPLSGNSTGACTINGDVPAEQAKRFANCCGGSGTCVPGALLFSSAGLATDSCAEADTYCVPNATANGQDPGYPSCVDSDMQAGACVGSCFINPWLTLIMDQGNCMQGGTKCVTCGVLSLSTGACL